METLASEISNKICGFLTTYTLKDNKGQNRRYHSYILTNSLRGCKILAKKRKLNEDIDIHSGLQDFSKKNKGYLIEKLSKKEDAFFLSKENNIDILHYICFLSFLAFKCGKLDGTDILSDVAVLHESIHFFTYQYKSKNKKFYIRELKKLLRNLESRVIGVFPR